MFRIRQIPDDTTPTNAAAIAAVQAMLKAQLPGISDAEVAEIPRALRDPFATRFRPILFVAERAAAGRVRGFALVKHAPDLDFCYLDYIVTAPGKVGGGVGGALYERVREHCAALGAKGLYLEALPDDPALSPEPEIRRQNVARLRFYERYGARPIVGTKYETPLQPGQTNPPYLVYDGLGRKTPPSRDEARRAVRAILERKYGARLPPGYADMVVESVRDDPIRLRPPRYLRLPDPEASAPVPEGAAKIRLVVNQKHDIHHIHERGYVEAPVRVRAILRAIEPLGLFERVEARPFADRHIRAVHDDRFVDYLRAACAKVEPGRSVYPYVFPVRNAARPPKDLALRAGYWCIDTFTPINLAAYEAARYGVDVTLTAAEQVLEGHRIAYALTRPPGHHAERRAFGGFCYFCNAAIAAHYMSRYGRVAILDIDYHHGNGQQDIFYARADVLTVSIHGHPSFAYPYFSGFREETGVGPGAGFNLNIPLPETITPAQYQDALDEALRRIERYDPAWLIAACGFDTAVGDPTGSWPHRPDDFAKIGRRIGELGPPILVVQEGGYRTRTLGQNAAALFTGLAAGAARAVSRPRKAPRRAIPGTAKNGAAKNGSRKHAAMSEQTLSAVAFRTTLRETDVEAIRSLVAATGFFTSEEVGIAAELVADRVEKGDRSDYAFLIAEESLAPGGASGRILGYSCFGPIPGTDRRFDLYWIAVDPGLQRQGLGRRLLAETERRVAALGGARLYVDTSTSEKYAPTRAFYRRSGYAKAAEMPDFFRDGDGKAIFVKKLAAPG